MNWILKLRENDSGFVVLLKDTFGDKLHDKELFAWLSKKLDFKFPSYLKRKIILWEENDYKEKRGSSSLSLEDKQYIHDLWIGNSIPSLDFRNGRDSVKMRYDKYERKYVNLNNDKHLLQRKVKCGFKVYVASHRVATCTIRKLRSKIMSEKGINISIGLLSYLKPFYITSPLDKEKVMCMCKLCLNFCLKFNPLMTRSKDFNGPHFASISSYYMRSCKCS